MTRATDHMSVPELKQHQDGTCGGDRAGCKRCMDIAQKDLPYGDERRLLLAERRNRPLYGYVNVHYEDALR